MFVCSRKRARIKKYFAGALKDVRPHGWCLTPAYLDYLGTETPPAPEWVPGSNRHHLIPLGQFHKEQKCLN